MSVLGAERQNWMSATLALATWLGPPAVLVEPLSKTRPGTSSVSSTVPPSCSTILMSLRSTFTAPAGSGPSIPRTLSTAIGARRSLFWLTTLLLRHVRTASTSRPRSARSTGSAADRSSRVHSSAALWNDPATMAGCIPLARRPEQASRSAPARTTTDVVPSPASTSWLWLHSTSILAAGWSTFIFERIVAPSFEIRTSPDGSCISLSMPRGPRDVRTASATALAATMLDIRTSFPLLLSWRVSPFEGRGRATVAMVFLLFRARWMMCGRETRWREQ
mmetsp:Transcript_27861/g.66341  ORF Transcript_27861/g.66341 Transcript_27861/m.66341 type:complete len:277 (-) Transcript_27861:149-979(-)